MIASCFLLHLEVKPMISHFYLTFIPIKVKCEWEMFADDSFSYILLKWKQETQNKQEVSYDLSNMYVLYSTK
jgi:hypothetical protein